MIIPNTYNTEEVIGSYYVNTSESNMLMYSKTFIIFNSYHLGKFNNENVIQLNTNKSKAVQIKMLTIMLSIIYIYISII